MAREKGQSQAAAYKAVEQILARAVSKVLSKFGGKQGADKNRTRILSSLRVADNESSDSDDFQQSRCRARKRNKE